ncbi:unnamed protein product [Schistosoma margrebowiei]|uniref:Uncharacterized protein n=1 Tax=Schistosoma margrebowiei TaxID=48269 RepID=A0AA84ZU97_9TREM|nr:unnamed protein product [Schistosoma margrebowiei]
MSSLNTGNRKKLNDPQNSLGKCLHFFHKENTNIKKEEKKINVGEGNFACYIKVNFLFSFLYYI